MVKELHVRAPVGPMTVDRLLALIDVSTPSFLKRPRMWIQTSGLCILQVERGQWLRQFVLVLIFWCVVSGWKLSGAR